VAVRPDGMIIHRQGWFAEMLRTQLRLWSFVLHRSPATPDLTHLLVCDQTYVALAMGRDDLDAAPQRGSFKGEEGSQPPQMHLQITRQQ
jgi:hypothetical protein